MARTAFYFGRACKTCGGTKRYQSNASCVSCTSQRNSDRGRAETAARRLAREGRVPQITAAEVKPPKQEDDLEEDYQLRNTFLQRRWGSTA